VYRRLGMADQANAAVQRATELGIASRIVESTPWLGQ
jgi:hypothetical protein